MSRINKMRNYLSLLLFTGVSSVSVFAQASATSETGSDEEVVALPVFEVSTDQDRGYGSTHSLGGSRVNLQIKEIPGSIISLNEQFLKDVAALEVNDAIDYVSGIATRDGAQYTLRGYAQLGVNYRDGLPDREIGLNTAANDAGSFQRLEVIKGPAGILFGSHSMGGVVNRISKMPLSKPRTMVQVGVSGGWDEFIRGMVDTTGPLGQTGLSHRLVLVDREGEKSWGGEDTRRTAVGVLTYDFGKQKSQRVWYRYNYFEYKGDSEQGWNFIDKDDVLPDFFLGDGRDYTNFPDDSYVTQSTRSMELGYRASVDALGGKWTVRLMGRKNDNWGDKSRSYSGGTVRAFDANGNVLGTNREISSKDPRVADWRTTLIARDFESFRNDIAGYFDAVGEYEIGPSAHTLVFSFDARESEQRRTFEFWNAKFPNAPASAPNTYSLIPERSKVELEGVTFEGIKAAGGVGGFTVQNAPVDTAGQAYALQDNISFLKKRLIFVAGGRYDNNKNEGYRVNRQLEETPNAVIKKNAWTYKFGVVVEPIRGLGIFAQEATTFNPGSSEMFPNQEGKIDELGVKLDFDDSNLVATASVFDMELTNVVTPVARPPEQGGGTVNIPAGTQNTKGWELDVSWQPVRGLNMVLAYSDLTSVNERGLPFRGVPQSATYSAFVKYTFTSTILNGVGLGASFKHTGSRTGDSTATFWIPSDEVTNLTVSYAKPKSNWSIQANVINVFDTDALRSSVSDRNLTAWQPITYRLTFNQTF